MSDTGYSYIGRRPCGCVVAAYVDDPAHAKHIAKEIATWIREGLTVERVTHDYVREHFTFRCDCAKRAKKENVQFALFEVERKEEK